MAEFIIQWKEVSVRESYINFWVFFFFLCRNMVFLLKQKINCTLFEETLTLYRIKLLFHGITFLRIICNDITFPNIQIFFLPLNSQNLPKILPNMGMGCVIKSHAAYILRSGWEKNSLREAHIFIKEFWIQI